MSIDKLRAVKRTVGVAGGNRKLAAIRGALKGGWINLSNFYADMENSEIPAGSTRALRLFA